MTSRGPLTLAALASAAVPGLDPSSVEEVLPTGRLPAFEVAFVQDHEHRRWVIRAPRTPAASAQLEQSAALLALLARRLTMPVPAVKGWAALPEGGRAAVHSYLTGRMVDLPGIAPGSRLATGLGRAVAQLHNLDVSVYEESGAPVYDAQGYRSRRLADLDRAATTGRVPSGLLGRWEKTLENQDLWSFTPTPTHGAIGGATILATPDDGDDPDVKAFLGWESAQVADPADDFAQLVGALDPQALETVMEAYAHARVDRPDPGLLRRAHLVGELHLVRTMMAAVAAGDEAGADEQAAGLRDLDERLTAEDEAATESEESDDTDAVQVEALRAPTPVSLTEEAGDESTANAREREVPEQEHDIVHPSLPPAAPEAPEPVEAPPTPTREHETREHETADITPLADDDPDDVIDPSRR